MGRVVDEVLYYSSVPPAKLFNGLTIGADILILNVMKVIKSVEVVKGNGGPGTVKKLTVADYPRCGETSFVLHEVDAIDEVNKQYNYSLVGGTGLDPSLEKVSLQTKVVPGHHGGSIGKISVIYHTRGGAVLSDAVREETKKKGAGIFDATEHYLYEKS